jgi:hypothetical protein
MTSGHASMRVHGTWKTVPIDTRIERRYSGSAHRDVRYHDTSGWYSNYLDLTTRQLKSATAAYPTVGSDLGSML